MIDYNTTHKNEIRSRLVDELKLKYNKNDNLKIITMAGEQGLCAKLFKDNFPNCEIFNIERDRSLLFKYRILDLNTKDYNMEMTDFIKRNMDDKFHFMYYDAMCQLSPTIVEDLNTINNNKMVQGLALTIRGHSNFRPTNIDWNIHGWRKKYGVSNRSAKNGNYKSAEYPIRDMMKDIMTKYDLKYAKKYKRDESSRSVEMTVYKFDIKNNLL